MDCNVSVQDGTLCARKGGAGAPSVLFESGGMSDSSVWREIEPAIAPYATTLVYDRRGTGNSAAVDGPRRLADLTDDLEALVDALRPPTPLILVGASLGGLLVRLFAARRLADVRGLVLVDPTHELMPERFAATLSPDAYAALIGGSSIAGEGLDLVDALRSMPPIAKMPHTPLIVLSGKARIDDLPRSLPPNIAREIAAALDTVAPALHRRLASDSAHGTHHWIEGAGHNIHRDRPQLVIDAIRSLLDREALRPG
jgi:pimeloyl-ACP methyl ester carboxylesterase